MENSLQLIDLGWLMSSIGIERFMEKIAVEEDRMERREIGRGEQNRADQITGKDICVHSYIT